ncbi:gustatory receptor for sugar taste 64a-like [Chironomus tepperi]|uniref:gustatory receptor for sugar taste 64a-like n=1 Tax=Chironomus tepperi TaxID=113505 RepID=UPI00391F37AC
MMLSIGITTRFNQYNHLFRKIIQNRHNECKPTIWRDLRTHYIQLLELTKFIDSHISGVVLISASHNMLTVLLKCFFAFRPTRIDILDTIYFWFFVVFLITRTFLVLYLPAMINEAACRPLTYIRQIPQDKWNSDMDRLHDIISIEAPSIGFTGKQFFYITKGTILSMIGTIITFEIILLDEIEAHVEGLCASID